MKNVVRMKIYRITLFEGEPEGNPFDIINHKGEMPGWQVVCAE